MLSIVFSNGTSQRWGRLADLGGSTSFSVRTTTFRSNRSAQRRQVRWADADPRKVTNGRERSPAEFDRFCGPGMIPKRHYVMMHGWEVVSLLVNFTNHV